MNRAGVLTMLTTNQIEILNQAYLKPNQAFNKAELTNLTRVLTRITTNQVEVLNQVDLEPN